MTFFRAFSTPDLRKKLLFTAGMIVLFRFGSYLPTPGVSQADVKHCSGLVMLLTPPVSPAIPGPAGDPEIPRGAREVSAGRYRAWLIPPGQAYGPAGAGLVIESAAPGGQDLVIGASGLSEPALVALVGAGLGG